MNRLIRHLGLQSMGLSVFLILAAASQTTAGDTAATSSPHGVSATKRDGQQQAAKLSKSQSSSNIETLSNDDLMSLYYEAQS